MKFRLLKIVIPYILAALSSLLTAKSQDIRILDAEQDPIPGVLILHQPGEKVYTSDAQGWIRGLQLKPQDTLLFQHPSYYTRRVTHDEIQALNYKIFLEFNTLNLEQVIVSANKWETKRSELSQSVRSLEAKDFQKQETQTAADLIGLAEGVFIQKSQLGGGSPMIRGFSANSVLLVIDGVRMNNAIYRSGNLQNVISLDAHSIERAEVLYGPGSLVYGSDALGGVMDFHTWEPRFATENKSQLQTRTSIRYASANQEKTFHSDWNLAGKRWAWQSSLTYSDYEDLSMGTRGPQAYTRPFFSTRLQERDTLVPNADRYNQVSTGYEQFNSTQKFRFRIGRKHLLEYAWYYSKTSQVPRYDRLIQPADDGEGLRNAQWYYGPQKWQMHRLSFSSFQAQTWYDQARLTAAFQHYEESRQDRRFGQELFRSRQERVHIYSLNWDLEKNFNLKNTLYYGLEFLYNRVQSRAGSQDIVSQENFPLSTRYPDGSKYYSTAAYANFRASPHPLWTYAAGIRYTFTGLRASLAGNQAFFELPFENIQLDNGSWNASLGLVYRPSSGHQFNGNVSSGFRAPNIDDAAKVFDSEPGRVVVPNPNLRPEQVYNLDLAWIWNPGEAFQLEVNFFHTWARDLMVRRNFLFEGQDSIVYDGSLSRVQALVNAERARIYGLQFSQKWQISPSLGWSNQVSWMRGKTSEGNFVRHASPLFGRSEIVYQKAAFRFYGDVSFQGSIPYARLAPSERGKAYLYAPDKNGNPHSPGWYSINVKVTYDWPFIKESWGSISSSIRVENILDKLYRPYSSGISAPGRNFIFSLRSSF